MSSHLILEDLILFSFQSGLNNLFGFISSLSMDSVNNEVNAHLQVEGSSAW